MCMLCHCCNYVSSTSDVPQEHEAQHLYVGLLVGSDPMCLKEVMHMVQLEPVHVHFRPRRKKTVRWTVLYLRHVKVNAIHKCTCQININV